MLCYAYMYHSIRPWSRYRGQCYPSTRDRRDISDDLWTRLARYENIV